MGISKNPKFSLLDVDRQVIVYLSVCLFINFFILFIHLMPQPWSRSAAIPLKRQERKNKGEGRGFDGRIQGRWEMDL